MEIGTLVKFTYTDANGFQKKESFYLTKDIVGEDVISDDEIVQRLSKSMQNLPLNKLKAYGFILAARCLLKKVPDATNIYIDTVKENKSDSRAILIFAIIALIVVIIVLPLLVILGLNGKLFLKGFYEKCKGKEFNEFAKKYTFIGIGLYAVAILMVLIDKIFKLYMLSGPAFMILFIGGIAYFVVSLLIVKKKFLGEGHKMEFFNTLKSGFKKANKDNEK